MIVSVETALRLALGLAGLVGSGAVAFWGWLTRLEKRVAKIEKHHFFHHNEDLNP